LAKDLTRKEGSEKEEEKAASRERELRVREWGRGRGMCGEPGQ